MPTHSHSHLETLPAISHHSTSNYVTQSSLFDNISTGKLTDRKIKAYQLSGKYGPEEREKAKLSQQTKNSKTKRNKPFGTREELIKLLI